MIKISYTLKLTLSQEISILKKSLTSFPIVNDFFCYLIFFTNVLVIAAIRAHTTKPTKATLYEPDN